MADEKKKETSKTVDKLVEEIAKLSVIELSELVNALQDKLGVTAAPVAAAAPVTPTGAPQEATGAPAEAGAGAPKQTLTMTNAGANKIAVIKALREINQNWTLMEAKGMTETVPAEILKEAKTEDVKVAADKLKAAGATVEVK